METYTCQYCGDQWTRPLTRGQRPKWCSPHCGELGKRGNAGVCAYCHSDYIGFGKKYCSTACAAAARPQPPPKPPKPPKPPRPDRDGPTCRIFTTICAICDKPFVSPYTISTCSPCCSLIKKQQDKHEAKHRHRATKRDAFVARVYRNKIYKRDRGICGICHKKVNMTAPPNDPLAPSLDHIVALSLGGTHEPSNVRLTHMICNSLRGARIDEVQLALFG